MGPLPPVLVEDGVGRKVRSETFPSCLSLPRLPEHLLLGPGGEAGNQGAFLPWGWHPVSLNKALPFTLFSTEGLKLVAF